MLRAINTARKLLLCPINGQETEVKSQLPKYVVVISATDVTNSEMEEIWLEDDEPQEDWEVVAKNFTKVRQSLPELRRTKLTLAVRYSHRIPPLCSR